MYDIDGYNLFRNDSQSLTSRPFGGMAVFSRLNFCQDIHVVVM